MMNNFVFEELIHRNKFNDFNLDDLLEGQFENFVPWHDSFVKYCSDKKVEVTLKNLTLQRLKLSGLQLLEITLLIG